MKAGRINKRRFFYLRLSILLKIHLGTKRREKIDTSRCLNTLRGRNKMNYELRKHFEHEIALKILKIWIFTGRKVILMNKN